MSGAGAPRIDSPQVDSPQVAAAVAARKKSLDRQAIAAVLGMAVVAGVFTIHPDDHAKTIDGLTSVAPWLVGLSILIVLANRATLHLQSQAIRKEAGAGR